MRLSDFKVLSFDCYGTLIDWETGILQALAPLVAQLGPSMPPETVLASFARHESAQEHETPGLRYPELLAQVHRRLAEEWGITANPEAAAAFGRSVGDWPAFPDSATALGHLKEFYRLVILSNVDRASFARSNEKLRVAFDRVFTAEEIGSYKPDPRNFRHMLDALGADGHRPAEILHVAQSLFHDHQPANALGLRSAWIDRRRGGAGSGATPPAAVGVHWDFRFESLAELVEAHRAEHAG